MNLYKNEKAELIKNGTLQKYKLKKKECFNNGDIPPNWADFYDLDEFSFDLIQKIEKSTKRKKKDFRRHTYFMSDYYKNIGLLTLGFKNKSRDELSFNWIKELMTKCLKLCFCDYIGKLEISPNGKLHGHFIVAWNDEPITREIYRDGHKNLLVINKTDLTNFWYGETDENGQPSKYGIYDLVLVTPNKTERDKATNYTLKSLNTMESYIQKDEQINDIEILDEDLIFNVNNSSVIVARGTPYQQFKKDQDIQDKEIKGKMKAFYCSDYEEHKFGPKSYFRNWAKTNKDTEIKTSPKEKMRLFKEDFKLIEPKDY